MKVTFSLDVDCWIDGVEVEGDSIEECKEKLLQMTVAEMLESGYVKQDSRTDIDVESIEDDDEDYEEDEFEEED